MYMRIMINGDENQTTILNQAIVLITSFKSKYGWLYINTQSRKEINFIFTGDNYSDKSKAIDEWISRLQTLLEAEHLNPLISLADNELTINFTGKKNGKKKRAS